MRDPHQKVELSVEEKELVVNKKAACPFIASAVNEDQLRVLHDARDPLASIEEVRRLGNTGGGNLGNVLVRFARGNHRFGRGDSGRLNRELPGDLFSLEFPGSQGSHPGHSGILQGDPLALDSGRLSVEDFERLTRRATDGWIKLSQVGDFIAENLRSDPRSKVSDVETAELLLRDAGGVVKTILETLLGKLTGADEEETDRDIVEKLTKLTGENNLVGSAGEFGLLFAFFANKPGPRPFDDEPGVPVEDLRAMFVEKHLPDGWETWKKTRRDWIVHTTRLVVSAAKAYHARD
jgi:hypothetical protein